MTPLHATRVPHRPATASRYATIAAVYVVAYVALDWASYVHPMVQLAITPWNPPAGLSLFLLLRYGLAYAPALVVSAFLGDVVVRGFPPDPLVTLTASLAIAAGYTTTAAVLAGPLRVGPRLANLRDISLFVAAAGIAPLPIAFAYAGLYVAAGQLPAADFAHAVTQFWIGDAIGIVVTTPLLLEFAARPLAPRPRFDVELVLQAGAVLLALWIVFGVRSIDEYKFFYLLFLPLVWIAMRRGIRGAVVASLAFQLGVIAAATGPAPKDVELLGLQFLMLVLAVTALFLGMAVTEREDARRSIAARDAALNRALRMATAGELAGAVAHELNQPLSAIGTYARACVLMLERPESAPLLRETLDKVTGEVGRAAEVIRRLREFYRTGSTRRERSDPGALVKAAIDTLRPRIMQHGIEIEVSSAESLPPVDVDRIQMHTVLNNLLANAVEALVASRVAQPRIRVDLRARSDGVLAIAIADNGPGIAADVAGSLFEPLITTKPDGMGLGLAISHSIVEAHGGGLRVVSSGADGATFELTLPFARTHDHAQRT